MHFFCCRRPLLSAPARVSSTDRDCIRNLLPYVYKLTNWCPFTDLYSKKSNLRVLRGGRLNPLRDNFAMLQRLLTPACQARQDPKSLRGFVSNLVYDDGNIQYKLGCSLQRSWCFSPEHECIHCTSTSAVSASRYLVFAQHHKRSWTYPHNK